MYGDFFFFILIVSIIIELIGISAFVGIPEEKGYEGKRGTVWLLGIFCTIVVAGLYVAALPDKFARPLSAPQNGLPGGLPVVTDDELPSL